MRKRMKDIAYEKIQEMILNGQLGPSEMINEYSLAAELNISRTPVREALTKLENEGYVHAFPNKGVMVATLDADDIVKISEVREALEGFAVRLACDRMDPEVAMDLKRKLEAIPNLEEEEYQEKSFMLGRQLHNQILKSTGNELLMKYVLNITAQLNRIMLLSRYAPSRAQTTFDEHMLIVDAILSKDKDLAEQSMRNHIISVANDVINLKKMDYV
ncbi:GntR family transcriptional regulator [Bacilliculturomica massiliensis]|uniref:GntR family transcriptional regulator n=1 Tax=Bacilliculturomica massiliensis TaxID=1917867 RepID=UPI0010314B53|nr:GntR family transcriptional regulator [Bacilliculturomica massiliensis]